MSRLVDIAIIGGGVIGSSIAYHLMKRDATLNVVVFEPDPTYCTASSALSASSIRQQFSTPLNIAMSRYGMEFLSQATQSPQDEDEPHVGLVERGYLYLASAGGRDRLQANHRIQSDAGVDVALLETGELQRLFPWLATGDLAAGSLGLSGEGWFDGYGLLQLFRGRAKKLGAIFRTARVEAVRLTGDHVDALVLDNGEEVLCSKVVNAAGPAAASVARMAGIELPVRAEKRSIFVFDCKDGPADMPLVIDPSGVYFRPEGKTFIAGAPATVGIDSTTLDVDYGLFDEIVWPTLANRVPAFEAIKLQGAWAGYYEMNLFDHNAIVGKAPNVENFYLANGFSGHGMQQSPAVGRGMAELLLAGSYEELDLSPLGYDRILANEPIVELNVI